MAYFILERLLCKDVALIIIDYNMISVYDATMNKYILLNDNWTKQIFRYIHWEVAYYYYADLSTWVDPFKPKPTKKIYDKILNAIIYKF
jgi:hypothetical protein